MGFGTVSTMVSAAIHLVVGVRLLFLARRTFALPELLIGAALFLVGVAKTMDLVAGSTGGIALTMLALSSLSHLLFYLVWWYVFRRRAGWAIVLCVAAALVMLAAFVYQLRTGWRVSGDGWGSWYNYVRTQVAVVGFAWGAVECLMYYQRLRKRIPLGLAKPSTALRFLFWGMSMVATLTVVAAITLQIELGLFSPTTVQVVWATMNLVSGACLWLSFLPPVALRSYVDRSIAEAVA